MSDNPFSSVDPAPPSSHESIAEAEQKLLDENVSLFERYRAMFALRNVNTDSSALALTKGLSPFHLILDNANVWRYLYIM